MSPAAELLGRCARAGITLTPTEHGTVRVRGSRLPADLVAAVRELKPEILRLLRGDESVADLTEVYSRSARGNTRRVSIEVVGGAGVTGGRAYRLVGAEGGEPLLVGLFASEAWARAWCAEHGWLIEAGAER